MLFFLIVLPKKPIECYLAAEDGEEQGEDAVAEVVDPGCVDYEGGGDGEGGDDEKECGPEHERAEGAPEGVIRPAPCLRFLRAPGQLHQSCVPAAFSVEEPFFSAPFSPDSPFLVEVSAFELPL